MTNQTQHFDNPHMVKWVISLDSLLSTMDQKNETKPTSLRQTMKIQNEPKLKFLGSWVLVFLGSWVLGFLGSWVLSHFVQTNPI